MVWGIGATGHFTYVELDPSGRALNRSEWRIHMSKFVAFLRDESGASAAEYVLIIAVVGGALTAILGILTGAMSGSMTKMATVINP